MGGAGSTEPEPEPAASPESGGTDASVGEPPEAGGEPGVAGAPPGIPEAGAESGGLPSDAGSPSVEPDPEPSLPEQTPYVFSVNTQGNVYVFEMDTDSGDLSLADELKTEGAGDDHFLAVHPASKQVFVVTSRAITALSFDPETATLTSGPTGTTGGGGTHVSVSNDGRLLVVAHYGEGAISVLNFEQGAFSAHQSFSSGQRAHSSRFHPSEPWVYIPCLGSNHIAEYAIPSSGTGLTQLPSPTLPVAGGPRHMTIHPEGKFAYILSELSSELRVLPIDATTGALGDAIDTEQLSTNAGDKWSSDVQITPDGNHLYAIDRNEQAMFHFTVAGDGTLTPDASSTSLGAVVRSFAMDPAGRYVQAGDQNGNLTGYAIDADSGALTPVPNPIRDLGLLHATAIGNF